MEAASEPSKVEEAAEVAPTEQHEALNEGIPTVPVPSMAESLPTGLKNEGEDPGTSSFEDVSKSDREQTRPKKAHQIRARRKRHGHSHRRQRIYSPPSTTSDITSDDSESSDAESENHFEMGMRPARGNLLRRDPYSSWEEWEPKDSDKQKKKADRFAQFAVVVRRERIGGKGRDLTTGEIKIHSIKIQSPLIRRMLDEVFLGYKGLSTKLKDLEFRAPFHAFFYRWDRLQACIAAEKEAADKDTITLQHMQLLIDVLLPEIQPHLDQRADLLANNLITFEYLWTIFEPKTLVYAKLNGQERVYQLESGSYEMGPGAMVFQLTVMYVDTDGKRFGCLETDLDIPSFTGIQPISSLPFIPLNLLPDTAALTKRLIDGVRIMIDSIMYDKHGDEGVSGLNTLDQLEEILEPPKEKEPFIEYDESYSDRGANKQQLKSGLTDGPDLTDDHLLLCTSEVRGYCLSRKLWVKFFVDYVRDIRWNEQAFSNLRLPQDDKDIMFAFVQSQLKNRPVFDDVIAGKGQGVIMLLAGEPGVGKTLTAESIAEEMKVPLYSMTAAELGDSSGTVENNLRDILDISTAWNAVLLLDECDVFLAERTISDLHRNKLVAVFLRLLEYYKGIMFLTTNRPSTFDRAFESRIDLTLEYPALDKDSRHHIWTMFLTRAGANADKEHKHEITDKELDILSGLTLNGRQIKNIVKTSRMLASLDEAPLTFEHVSKVLRVKRIDLEAEEYQIDNHPTT
ncbi:ATPase-like protein 3 [Elsinoe fawcettii]|nr:ATPase-like protein 3 [Elsinoe fawcettii]